MHLDICQERLFNRGLGHARPYRDTRVIPNIVEVPHIVIQNLVPRTNPRIYRYDITVGHRLFFDEREPILSPFIRIVGILENRIRVGYDLGRDVAKYRAEFRFFLGA
jgi:hypothetical protein